VLLQAFVVNSPTMDNDGRSDSDRLQPAVKTIPRSSAHIQYANAMYAEHAATATHAGLLQPLQLCCLSRHMAAWLVHSAQGARKTST
jgi:hypothetical protein